MGILRLLGFKTGSPVYSEELGYTIRELPPMDGNASHHEFLALPKRDIPTLVEKYFAAMETGETAKWCRCPWLIHPDDRDVKANECRICGAAQGGPVHNGLPEDYENGYAHKFAGRRMRRMDDASDCPVHAKEGMLMYFFEWAFDQHE